MTAIYFFHSQCEPLFGWGFKRGGYQCHCKPGYRYPQWQRGPFQGIDIEQATLEEYNTGFACIPVEREFLCALSTYFWWRSLSL